MADFDPEKITRILEERCSGYCSEHTAAKEITELTGLSNDVARAFARGWSRQTPVQVRGYRKGKFYGNKKSRSKGPANPEVSSQDCSTQKQNHPKKKET